ncbi:MAG: DUF3192 domain-containing protein [Pseudomonadales bacterium]|nr:DUF3192 domain-containing protein [Pseudomonadales bacterium]
MTHFLKLIALLILLTSLSACVVAIGNDGWDEDGQGWKSRQEKNMRYINRLDLGTSIALIESDLGTPDFSDSFQRNGEVFQVIYYRTHHKESDGNTSRDETTPLVFIDKVLVGWGALAIEKATK